MKLYTSIIRFGTPQYDDAVHLRYTHLRKPLNLYFSTADFIDEVNQFHIGLYDLRTDEIVACGSLVPETKSWKMRQVVVAHSYRERGHGRDLVDALETFAQAKRTQRIYCHARKSVESFYTKLGYKTISDTFTEVSIPHVKMMKDLR